MLDTLGYLTAFDDPSYLSTIRPSLQVAIL